MSISVLQTQIDIYLIRWNRCISYVSFLSWWYRVRSSSVRLNISSFWSIQILIVDRSWQILKTIESALLTQKFSSSKWFQSFRDSFWFRWFSLLFSSTLFQKRRIRICLCSIAVYVLAIFSTLWELVSYALLVTEWSKRSLVQEKTENR